MESLKEKIIELKNKPIHTNSLWEVSQSTCRNRESQGKGTSLEIKEDFPKKITWWNMDYAFQAEGLACVKSLNQTCLQGGLCKVNIHSRGQWDGNISGQGALCSLPHSLTRKLTIGFDILEYIGMRNTILAENSLELVEEWMRNQGIEGL